MLVAIPAEFESFARDQIAAGVVASEEEAVAVALRGYLDDVKALRALVDPELEAMGRDDTVDGETFMRELLDETEDMVRAAVAKA